jgi:hypothetical protein
MHAVFEYQWGKQGCIKFFWVLGAKDCYFLPQICMKNMFFGGLWEGGGWAVAPCLPLNTALGRIIYMYVENDMIMIILD